VAVGKTVFTASMYAKLREESHGVAIRAVEDQIDLELGQNISALYLSNEWPSATIGMERSYEFEVLFHGKPVARVDFISYGGDVLSLGEGIEGAERLLRRLRESNSIFWLIDMYQVSQREPDIMSARLTTKIGRVLQLCRQALADDHSIRSILYVGTKSDVVQRINGSPDWDMACDLLVEHLRPERMLGIPYSAVIPVSAVGRVTDNLKVVGDAPYNVEWPILLALAFMFEDDVIEKEARVRPNTLIGRLIKVFGIKGVKDERPSAQGHMFDTSQLLEIRKTVKELLENCPRSIKIFRQPKASAE
jgi:hypothetical protein